jgi:hypothetical protein
MVEGCCKYRPDRNQIYGLHVASTRELRKGCTVSIIDIPYSDPNYLSAEFNEIMQKIKFKNK